MDSLLALRCLNLQRGIDELGSADLFLKKYGNFFGEDKTMSSSHLFRLLSGKIPIREQMAREIEQVLHKPLQWLDREQMPVALDKPFDAWPRSVAGAAYQGLSAQQQAQLKQDVDALVEQWSVSDWRHIRVTTPGKS